MSKLKKVQITQQDIWDACRPNIHKSKKKYKRKAKHKRNKDD